VEELLASPLRVRSVVVAPDLDATDRGARLRATLMSTASGRGFDLIGVSDA
jgi:hypothetical protein